MYGHVNNVKYYSYFDTIINEYEIKFGNLRPQNHLNNEYGVFCVSSSCTYLKPLEYPQIVEAGLCIEKIGYSSIVYNVGIFIKGEDDRIPARAFGDFVCLKNVFFLSIIDFVLISFNSGSCFCG